MVKVTIELDSLEQAQLMLAAATAKVKVAVLPVEADHKEAAPAEEKPVAEKATPPQKAAPKKAAPKKAAPKPAEPEEDVMSFDQYRAALSETIAEKGMDAVKKQLEVLGFENAKAVPEDQYAEVAAKIKKALADA